MATGDTQDAAPRLPRKPATVRNLPPLSRKELTPTHHASRIV